MPHLLAVYHRVWQGQTLADVVVQAGFSPFTGLTGPYSEGGARTANLLAHFRRHRLSRER
jgi:hypothetical protein